MTEDIKIRACGKSELALLYFPTANSSHTAVNHLMAWVKRIPELVEGLQKLGLSQDRQVFHRPRGAAHRGLPRLSITGGG